MQSNYYILFLMLFFSTTALHAQNVGIGEATPDNAKLVVSGNLLVGSDYTDSGSNKAAVQPDGACIQGRTIIGDDGFFYGIDKLVVYGNTESSGASATSGDNSNGLTYAINGYTSNGHAVYGEDNEGGTGLEANVNGGTSTNRGRGVYTIVDENSYGLRAVSQNTGLTAGYVGIQGIESTQVGWAILASGDVGSTTGNYLTASDERMKKNILPVSSALSLVTQLKTYQYDMRHEDYPTLGFAKNKQYGFMAQELEQVIPELVSEKSVPLNNDIQTKDDITKNGKIQAEDIEIKMVNYVGMVPILTQAINEQQAIIEEMKEELQALKAELEELKSRD